MDRKCVSVCLSTSSSFLFSFSSPLSSPPPPPSSSPSGGRGAANWRPGANLSSRNDCWGATKKKKNPEGATQKPSPGGATQKPGGITWNPSPLGVGGLEREEFPLPTTPILPLRGGVYPSSPYPLPWTWTGGLAGSTWSVQLAQEGSKRASGSPRRSPIWLPRFSKMPQERSKTASRGFRDVQGAP